MIKIIFRTIEVIANLFFCMTSIEKVLSSIQIGEEST